MVSANSFMRLVMFTKGNGRETKRMERVLTRALIQVVLIRVTGRTTFNMARVLKHGWMGVPMKETSFLVKKVDSENNYGLMAQYL